MIDLDKLNNKIDNLFEQETSESLTHWLLNKRGISEEFFGKEGSINSLNTITAIITADIYKCYWDSTFIFETYEDAEYQNFSLAA